MLNFVSRHRYLMLALIGIFPFFVNGPINARIYQNPLLYWGFEMFIWVLIPLLVLFAASRAPGFKFADLGFHARLMDYRNYRFVIILSLAFAPICYWFYTTSYGQLSAQFPGGGFFQYQSVIPSEGILRLAVIGYFAVSAGLVEEFFFRGLLYRASLEFSRPALFYVLVTPVLFSLVHWESGIANLFATYLYGWLMALAFLGFRNIWPLIVGHIYTDLIWFS